MTIEEVMKIAVSYGYGPRNWTDELRAALLALVAQARDEARDEEAEDCRMLSIEVERLTALAAWNQDNVNALLAQARDEEAEACAEIVMAEQATPHGLAYCEAAIRARIAARAEVAK